MAARGHAGQAMARLWHHVDATDMVPGRLATRLAALLMGKHKPAHAPCSPSTGDWAVVTNAGAVRLTGAKAAQRLLHRHTGYPGGYSRRTLGQAMAADPAAVLRRAVWGMLPKDRLRPGRIARLRVFAGPHHPYAPCIARVHAYPPPLLPIE